MNNVTYLKKINEPANVELKPIELIYRGITSDKWAQQTNVCHLLYNETLKAKDIEEIKKAKTAYDAQKNKLTATVFSGEFTHRSSKSCVLYWARVVLDIDHIDDELLLAKIKDYFRKLPYVVMIFRSPSGHGLKIVCKVQYKGEPNIIDFHNQAFESLKIQHDVFLKKHKKEIDPSGKDLARACYMCRDEKAYYNADAEDGTDSFEFTYTESRPNSFNDERIEKTPYRTNSHYAYLKEASKEGNDSLVQDILLWCNNNNIDITNEYNNWLTVLWALKHSFPDEIGYQHFDGFSRLSAKFNEKEVRTKWDQNKIDPLKPKVSLGSLVYICKQYGYEIHKDLRNNKEYFYNILIDTLVNSNIFLRFEEDSCKLQIKKGDEWTTFSDRDEDQIRIGILLGKLSKGDMVSFLQTITPSVSLHKEFLKTLPTWDGTDRLIQLADTLETEEAHPLKNTYIKKWCIGFIAQLHNDGRNGKVNENMIILSGSQYIGKSKWCNRLLPDEWKDFFTTKNIDLTQKDDHILLSENYIIFMDEGLSLRKNDVRALKTLLSSDKFSGRAAYGRNNNTYVRYSSFIASTNDEQILSDDTGNRRYWVIPTTKANFNHKIDMYQLWSQCLELYKAGEQYWLTEEEMIKVKDVNANFETEDAAEDYVKDYIRVGNKYYSATDIRDYIISCIGKQYMNEVNLYRVGRALKKLGYKKIKKRYGNNTKYVYACEYVSSVRGITNSDNMFE